MQVDDVAFLSDELREFIESRGLEPSVIEFMHDGVIQHAISFKSTGSISQEDWDTFYTMTDDREHIRKKAAPNGDV